MTNPSPNILLVVLDSVRAQNTSLHGYSHSTTPFLDEFGETATVYTQARAPSTWSLPSHVSLLTGEHTAVHQITQTEDKLAPGNTIFEELSDKGYTTGVFSENAFLTKTTNGLNESFDHNPPAMDARYPEALNPAEFVFRNDEGEFTKYLRECLQHAHPLKSILNGIDVKLRREAPWIPGLDKTIHADGDAYVDQFLDWIDSTENEWGACINLMDAHTPFEPTKLVDADATLTQLEEDIENYSWDFYTGDVPWWVLDAMETLYNDAIRQADSIVEYLINSLEEKGELDNTLIVITSDHGEGFGEESELLDSTRIVGHGNWVNEELLHVPLVVKYPNQTTGARVDSIATLTQFPTVVNEVLNGNEESFSPENKLVFASSHYQGDDKVPEDETPYLDKSVLKEDSFVVYQESDKSILKHSFKGKQSQTHPLTSSNGGGSLDVKIAFDELEGSPLTEDTTVEYDDETLDRLEDLGYA